MLIFDAKASSCPVAVCIALLSSLSLVLCSDEDENMKSVLIWDDSKNFCVKNPTVIEQKEKMSPAKPPTSAKAVSVS